jgi:hypothetical protein
VTFVISFAYESSFLISLGSINDRLSNYEVIREKKEKTNRLLQFRRVADDMAKIDVSTTTGIVFPKETLTLPFTELALIFCRLS